MIRKRKITVCLILLFLFLPLNVFALDIQSENYVLYNLENDHIVLQENKDEITSIASLTKIMTTIVAIENMDDLNKTVKITNEMLKGLAEQNASVLGLRVGQVVTIEDLLYGSLLSSGADCTNALAISLFGNEAKFVQKMNDKAKELHMSKTVFTNTTGLDTKNQSSSVNDIAILLKYCLKNDIFYKVFTTKQYSIKNSSFTAISTFEKSNEKLGLDMSYILGSKTGYTDNAGRCLASLAYDDINNIHYLLVTTKATGTYHILDAKTVYDYTFSNYKNHTLIEKGQVLKTIPIQYGKKESLVYKANEIIDLYYKNDEFDPKLIRIDYKGLDTVSFLNKKGSKIGTITIRYDKLVLRKIDLKVEEKIKFSLIRFISQNIMWIIGITFILVIGIFVKNRRKKI